MSANNAPAPKRYHEFKARFPKLAEAWDLTREASLAGLWTWVRDMQRARRG